jgi:hypothetical protein
VVVSFFEWVQNLQNLQWDDEEVSRRLDRCVCWGVFEWGGGEGEGGGRGGDGRGGRGRGRGRGGGRERGGQRGLWVRGVAAKSVHVFLFWGGG